MSGVDDANTTWIATFVLIRSEAGGLAGHIDWLGANGQCGREHIVGEFDADTRVLEMRGTKVDHGDRVVPCRYRSVLSQDGSRLEKGQWLGDDVIPGEWRGRRIELR